MKRKYLSSGNLKRLFLAVPASALMLGAAQAGTTVGLNFQSWYYDSGTTPQTVGYGAGYQTTGFPATARAFGVDVANWFNTDPLPASSAVSDTVTFGGTLTAQIAAPNSWQSGIGALNPGWVPEVVSPGNDEVTWGYLDDGNADGQAPSVSVSGLSTVFPNGYVIQTIAANGGVKTYNGVDFTDGVTVDSVTYTNSTYYVPSSIGYDGSVGLSEQSAVFTSDTIYINCQPKTSGNRSTLAGFIITDMPVVSVPPAGRTNDYGSSFTLSGAAIGIPPLSYQWRHDGTNLPNATASSYTNASATTEAAGDYELVVNNSYGSTTSSVAHVSILTAPSIAVDLPATVTNYSTMNASFSVVAGGVPPFTYTWLKDGQPLSATAPSLNLTNLQTSDEGGYQVILENSYGSVTSSVVQLTVLSSAPPYEGFDYADGDLAGRSGGVGWNSAWVQETNYSGGNAVFTPATPWRGNISELVSSGGAVQLGALGTADFDDIRDLVTSVGGNGYGTIYLSFVAQVTNSTWGGIELIQDGNTSLFLGSSWYGENWGWGARYPADVTSSVSPFTYSLLVYRFDYTPTNTLVRLYVNPSSLSVEPATPSISGTEPRMISFDRIRIVTHGHYGTGAGPDGVVDEIRVGGTWAAVTPHKVRTDAPFALQFVPGGVIQDTKPLGTPHPGLSRGTSWLDSSTDYNTLTRTGVEQFSAANEGQITVASDPDFNTTNGTICFWMQFLAPITGFPGPGTEGAMLFDRRTSSGTVIVLNESGYIQFQATGGPRFTSSQFYVADGNWHHVAVTYDQGTNGQASVYVDGMLDTVVSNPGAWSWPTNQEIELGRSHDSWWYIYDGQLDDVRIYDRILTPEEITTIATPATSDQLVDENALVLRYNFDVGVVGQSVTWPYGILQSSPALGPDAVWTDVPNAVSPLPILPTDPAKFYRLTGTP